MNPTWYNGNQVEITGTRSRESSDRFSRHHLSGRTPYGCDQQRLATRRLQSCTEMTEDGMEDGKKTTKSRQNGLKINNKQRDQKTKWADI